ncbi:MAG: hypothetical protein WD316_01420 [Phycisphaeraceae bacterium]
MSEVLIAPVVRRVVVGLGVVSFIATIALLLYGSTLADPRGQGRDSYARGVLGHRALFETLEAIGYDVRRARAGHFTIIREPLLLIDPEAPDARVGDTRHQLADVVADRAEAGLTTIVVLPKWVQSVMSGHGELVVSPGPRDWAQAVLDHALGERSATVRRGGSARPNAGERMHDGALGRFAIDLPRPQSIAVEGGGVEVLLGPRDSAAIVRGRDGRVIVVADPGLAHNATVHLSDHARIWHSLLGELLGVDAVAIDEVFHGHGRRPSLRAAMGRFPAVLLAIHGLTLGLLVALAGSRRFGPPLSAERPYGRGPREAVRVAAALLVAGCSPRTLARRYVEQVIVDLTNRLGTADADEVDERAQALDELAERRGDAIRASRCLAAARAAGSGAAALDIARDAQALYRLEHMPRESPHGSP